MVPRVAALTLKPVNILVRRDGDFVRRARLVALLADFVC